MILAFGFYSTYGRTIPFTFRPDMTWAEFVESEFNPNISDVYPEIESTDKMFKAEGNLIFTSIFDGTEWFESNVCYSTVTEEPPTDVAPNEKIKTTLYRTAD